MRHAALEILLAEWGGRLDSAGEDDAAKLSAEFAKKIVHHLTRRQAETDWRQLVGLTPLSQFMALEFDNPGYLVDGLLRHGGFSLVHAPPKAGKSVLIRNLVRAVARGEDFLDMPTEEGGVVYAAFEEEASTVQEEMGRMGMAGEHVHISVGRADAPASAYLEQVIAELKPSLVVLDTMLEAIPTIEDLNDYARAKPEISQVRQIARDTRTHIAMVHHARKSGGDYHEAVLGSSAIAAEFDVLIELTRKGEQQRFIRWEGRGDIHRGKTELGYDAETGLLALGERAVQQDGEILGEQIMRLWEESPLPLTQNAIRKRVGKHLNTVRTALKRLVAENRLIEQPGGVRGAIEYRPFEP